MNDDALHTYLRDHLAGAAFGTDLANHLAEHGEDDVKEAMSGVAPDIEEDRKTLLEVIDAVGAERNPVKEAVSWLGEKVAGVKFSGASSADDELGTFMGLEALMLGISGKRALWVALRALDDERLAAFDLSECIARAERQRDIVETLRLRQVAVALT